MTPEELGQALEAARDLKGISLKDEKGLSRLRKEVNIPKGFNAEGVREFFRTYSNKNVETQWPKLKPVKSGPSTRDLTQELDPDGTIAKSFKTMDWPDSVPDEARTVESFNKWNKGLYKIDKKKIQQLPDTYNPKTNPGGRLDDTGHSQLKGFNTFLGRQLRTQNQTTYRLHRVKEGDTLESISQETGVAPKVIEESAKNSKVDKQLLKNLEPGTTIKLEKIGDAFATIRPDLAEIDAGGSTRELKEWKAVETYIEQFADSEELSKYIRTSPDNYDVEARGTIYFDEEFAPTAESARSKIDEQQNRAIHQAEIAKRNRPKQLTGLEGINFKSKDFVGPDKIRNAKNVYRVIAERAGTSANPLANIAGDFAGVLMDGVAYAQNPKDKQALADLTLSGTQAAFSLGAIGLSMIPIPGARPGAYLLLRAGDKVGQAERLLNIGREGFGKVQKGTLFTSAANVPRKVKVK
tara:strand:+ start:69 stop:1466 length:1398 start_codon:yes stop_codon:yes gene_type:complete